MAQVSLPGHSTNVEYGNEQRAPAMQPGPARSGLMYMPGDIRMQRPTGDATPGYLVSMLRTVTGACGQEV